MDVYSRHNFICLSIVVFIDIGDVPVFSINLLLPCVLGSPENKSLIQFSILVLYSSEKMKEKLFSVNERSFATDCIANGRRLDGRTLSESRAVNVSVGPSWGFVDVSFDSTQAVASTTVEAVTPSPDRPNEGILTISIELSPTSSEASACDALYRSSTQPAFVETRTAIESFVRESRAIDTEALCILAGVKAWAVRVSIDIINDDGNSIDVAMMATMASLLHARRPDVTVSGQEVRIHTMDEREPVPLPIHHIPLAATFALFGGGKPYEPDTAVLDPTKLEQAASNGSVSFSFNGQGEVCGVFKAGGIPLVPSTFAQCAMQGAETARYLIHILKEAMADAAANHPMASARPMLVDAEPTALLPMELITMNSGDIKESHVPSSTWNAMPVADEVPPEMGRRQKEVETGLAVKDQGLREIFGTNERPKRNSVKSPPLHSSTNSKDEQDEDMEGELSSNSGSSSSSEDGLGGAIISNVRRKRR